MVPRQRGHRACHPAILPALRVRACLLACWRCTAHPPTTTTLSLTMPGKDGPGGACWWRRRQCPARHAAHLGREWEWEGAAVYLCRVRTAMAFRARRGRGGGRGGAGPGRGFHMTDGHRTSDGCSALHGLRREPWSAGSSQANAVWPPCSRARRTAAARERDGDGDGGSGCGGGRSGGHAQPHPLPVVRGGVGTRAGALPLR